MYGKIRANLIQFLFLALAGVSAALMYSPLTQIAVWVWASSFVLFIVVFNRYIPLSRIAVMLPTFVLFTFGAGGTLFVVEVAQEELIWVSLALTAFLGLFSYVLVLAWRQPRLSVANLSGITSRTSLPKRVKAIITTLHAMPLLIFGLMLFAVPGLYTFFVVFLVSGLLVLLRFLAEKHTTVTNRTQAAVEPMLYALAPQFFIYWSAPAKSEYQLKMWISHFQALDIPFFIMARTQTSFRQASKVAQGTPVILVKTLGEIEHYLVDSICAVFYVNNAAKNAHMVRFTQFTHIQLLHGDSEKKTSYNPVSNIYDHLFISGRAAQDRYALNGINIPEEKFTIISRPQVVNLEQVHLITLRDKKPDQDKQLTVLYAPTWGGDYVETAYSSLSSFQAILPELLQHNVRIIFRPHRYTQRHRKNQEAATNIQRALMSHAKSSGTSHIVIGKKGSPSLDESINMSDALIADISGIITDYLFTGKPIGVIKHSDLPEFRDPNFLLKDIIYTLEANHSNSTEFFHHLLYADPLAQKRLSQRAYFLGGDRPKDIKNLFPEAVRHCLEASRK